MPTGSGRTLGERPAFAPLPCARGPSPPRPRTHPSLAHPAENSPRSHIWPPPPGMRRWCSCCCSAGRTRSQAWTQPGPLSMRCCCPSPAGSSPTVWLWVSSGPGSGMPVGWGSRRAPLRHGPLSTVNSTGAILFSCRHSEENLTGEQGGPNVVPPYAAYAPPGTPQVGLGCPLPTARPIPPCSHLSCSHPDPRGC